jgi:hypothetical protein
MRPPATRASRSPFPSLQFPWCELPLYQLPRFRQAAFVLLANAALATTAPAQTMIWLDAGGARVQQPTSALRSAGGVGGGVWHACGPVAVAAEGSVTMASDSVSAAQYVVRTTLLPRAWARTDVDVSATTNGIVLPTVNGNRAVSARQTLLVRGVELIGQAGAGRTSRLDLRATGHRFSGGAAWQRDTRFGSWRGGAMLMRSWTDDFKLMEASGIVLRDIAPAYTLTDRQLEFGWQRGAWWLQTSRAWRRGTGATLGQTSAFHVAAAWHMNAGTTLIAQVGEQLADVVRGVPQARYTGLAMRWNPVRPRTLRRDARALADDRGGTVTINPVPDVRGEEVFVQRRAGRGELVISISAPPDAVVEVATSANEWTAVRLSRDGAAFVHHLTLPSGSHRVAVRINGGAWRAPRGLAGVADDFGGHAGVLVVP